MPTPSLRPFGASSRICPSGGHFFILVRHSGPLFICPSGGHFHLPWCGPLYRILVPAGTPSGIHHFLFDVFLGMRLFAGIGDHVVPRLHFGPDGLHMTFGLDWTASLARVWLWRMVLFGIGARIVP